MIRLAKLWIMSKRRTYCTLVSLNLTRLIYSHVILVFINLFKYSFYNFADEKCSGHGGPGRGASYAPGDGQYRRYGIRRNIATISAFGRTRRKVDSRINERQDTSEELLDDV